MMIVGTPSREIIREIREVPTPQPEPPSARSLAPLIWIIIVLQAVQIAMSFLK